MLKQDQIIKNTQKYFKTADEQNFMNEDFMKFLGEAFIKAPASNHRDLHNAFEGGLIDHLLRTTKFAISINTALPDNLKLPKESIIKVCFLYQIGKMDLFVPCTSDWHIKTGKLYDYNEKITSMKVGERSVYYALLNNVQLSDQEFQAIVNHDKEDTDKQARYHTATLGTLLKQANEWAIFEEKSIQNQS